MFFFYEPDTEQQPPPQEIVIPAGTVSTDDGLYLLSEEGLYIIFD